MDRLVKRIEVTEHIELRLFEAVDPKQGSYISIAHKPTPEDMQGEVIIPPDHIPQLVQALAAAAIELSSRGYYFMGAADAGEEIPGP